MSRAESSSHEAAGPGNNHRTLSGHILEQVTARSSRLTAPRVVRNWVAPMAFVVAVALLFSTGFYIVDLIFLGGTVSGSGIIETPSRRWGRRSWERLRSC